VNTTMDLVTGERAIRVFILRHISYHCWSSIKNVALWIGCIENVKQQ
jgi:hypothetical protein